MDNEREENLVSHNETQEVDSKKFDNFQEQTSMRMKLLCGQIARLGDIAEKSSVDYSQENVEKMFDYLTERLNSCKKLYMQKFDKKKNEEFDFKF